MPQHLEFADGAAKLFALGHEPQAFVEGALGDAELHRRENEPLDVEPGHQLRPSAVDLADHRVGGKPDVIEVEVVDLAPAHRVDPGYAQAIDVGGNVEHRDSLVLRPGRGRAGDEQDAVGEVRVRAPGLLPVDDPVVAAALGLAAQRADVRTRARLGHRDRERAALGEEPEGALTLFGGAEFLVRRARDEGRSDAADRSEPIQAALEQDAHFGRAGVGAAELLGHRDPEPAELGHLRVDLLAVRSPVGEGSRFLERPDFA